jgi:hypothetical protein
MTGDEQRSDVRGTTTGQVQGCTGQAKAMEHAEWYICTASMHIHKLCLLHWGENTRRRAKWQAHLAFPLPHPKT